MGWARSEGSTRSYAKQREGNEVALQCSHVGAGRAASLWQHFSPKTSSCWDTSALVQYAIPPHLLKMGRERGMCKGPTANVLWESLHMSSLCRGVSHKMLYFLLRALYSTDLLSTFEGEGWLPLFQLPNSAHPSMPHHQLQGLNPKQDSDEPLTEDRMPTSHRKTRHFTHASLKGGDHHCQARASSIAQLQGIYLSPFP